MSATAPHRSSPVARAEHFVWMTARVLEQRRFALHFGDGDADAVEAALAAYRNADGGFGHALDPDLRGPSSDPRHMAYALRLLEEAGRCGGRSAEDVCRYLTAVSTSEGGLPATRATGTGQPAAPWIQVLETPPADLAATARVLAVLHRTGVWHPWLFRATDYCWAAVNALEETRACQALAVLAFLDAVPDRERGRAAADRLGRLVREQHLAVVDPDRGSDPAAGPDERLLPHDFARSPGSLARRWFTDAEIDRSLGFLAAEQRADGGWPARRPAWAPGTELEWRPIMTIDALLTLRRYGRLV